MVVDVAPVLSELSELPPALLTLPLQVLLHSALLPVRGFLHVPPEQSLLKELLPAHVTPEETKETQLEQIPKHSEKKSTLEVCYAYLNGSATLWDLTWEYQSFFQL